MQGAHQKNPSAFAILLLRIFKKGYLYDNAETFNQEHAAENGDQPFFPDDDRQGGDDSAQRETARIAHENLCRISIVPKEPHACPNQGADEDGQFTQIGDIHDIEVFGETDIAAGIGENAQTGADNRARSGGQAVQAIRQIGAIGHRSNDEDHITM